MRVSKLEGPQPGKTYDTLPILLFFTSLLPRQLPRTVINNLGLLARHCLEHNETLRNTIHCDALAPSHFNLNLPTFGINCVVARMTHRLKRNSQRLLGNDLPDRSNKMPVRRELPAWISSLLFIDGL